MREAFISASNGIDDMSASIIGTVGRPDCRYIGSIGSVLGTFVGLAMGLVREMTGLWNRSLAIFARMSI